MSMLCNDSPAWFLEPSNEDNSWGKDGESIFNWLLRSTKPRAREARRFLNENIARLTPTVQQTIIHDLQHRWSTAFFELVVMRLLQEWQAELEIEVPNQDGRRPDFLAQFIDGQLVVEATSPMYNGAAVKEMNAHEPLMRIVEQPSPDGYRIGVKEVPSLGPDLSRKEFKNAVRDMVNPFTGTNPQEIPISGIDLFAKISSGVIRLKIFPLTIVVDQEDRREKGTIFGPCVAYMDNSQDRIRRSFNRKRKQVRNSDSPVLLIIDGGSYGADIEDFDEALIGSSVAYVSRYSVENSVDFILDGKLYDNLKSDLPPTYAAVLILSDVGFYGINEPILYPHPRYEGALPKSIADLRTRYFHAESRCIVDKASTAEVDARTLLNFVSQDFGPRAKGQVSIRNLLGRYGIPPSAITQTEN